MFTENILEPSSFHVQFSNVSSCKPLGLHNNVIHIYVQFRTNTKIFKTMSPVVKSEEMSVYVF